MLSCTYEINSRVEPRFILTLGKSIGFVLKTLIAMLWMSERALALPHTLFRENTDAEVVNKYYFRDTSLS
jgi:hypothetical protein